MMTVEALIETINDDAEAHDYYRRQAAEARACQGLSTEALEDGVVADLLAACKAVLDDWHGKPSNFERKEPPYLQQIRIAIAPSPGPGR